MKRKEIKNDDENGSYEQRQENKRKKCPYLDTIKPQLLDFDFEKVCSISLSDQNPYACLVCGKYFQGRGPNTHAYIHSVENFHHVFINLQNDKIYSLPDNYEVNDLSLTPIKNALRPHFSNQDILKLDLNRTLSQDNFGVSYLPGYIGLNNLKKTDYISVVIQALGHVIPLRDYFLKPENYLNKILKTKSILVIRFGEIMRKIWSPYNIKNTISPHEIIQAISVVSKKKFHIGKQCDAFEFLTWFLHELHRGLGGTKTPGSSIIHQVFQGIVNVKTLSDTDEHPIPQPIPFLHLSLDLPPTPLFKDSQGGNIIPQVPLFNVLEKFNGNKITHVLQGGKRHEKKYSIQTLPPYLIFHIHRFTKNNFFIEKNPTIVNFPIKNLEIKDYVDSLLPTSEEINKMEIKELKNLLKHCGGRLNGIVERNDLVKQVEKYVEKSISQTKYNLIANICHDSPVSIGKETTAVNMDPLIDGTYRVHVQNRATEQWYEIQDLHVQETMPQLIGISESYMLIYERK